MSTRTCRCDLNEATQRRRVQSGHVDTLPANGNRRISIIFNRVYPSASHGARKIACLGMSDCMVDKIPPYGRFTRLNSVRSFLMSSLAFVVVDGVCACFCHTSAPTSLASLAQNTHRAHKRVRVHSDTLFGLLHYSKPVTEYNSTSYTSERAFALTIFPGSQTATSLQPNTAPSPPTKRSVRALC
jgi:hypothetical protein